MNRISIGLCILALMTGCKAPECPTCAGAKLTNKWCDKCAVGYVAGAPIKSKLLYEALDAHGHDLNIPQIACAICQAAVPVDGYCEKCRVGWVRRQAYFSRLTYHLAKGQPCDPKSLACPDCRKNSEKYGWCDKCSVGMVGNVAIRSRSDFDGARRGYDLMAAAIEASGRCDMCGIACLTDNTCFICKIPYKDGKALPRVASKS